MSPLLRKVLRLALKSNNNHGSHPVPADFFTQWRAGAQIPAWGGPGPFLARRVTRSPRRHTGSRWNKSHPKSAKAHFASAPQNMLPRRCWNEPHSRQAASPVDSTSRFTACARAGHRTLHPPAPHCTGPHRETSVARSQPPTGPLAMSCEQRLCVFRTTVHGVGVPPPRLAVPCEAASQPY
jgi:hypothetical protein